MNGTNKFLARFVPVDFRTRDSTPGEPRWILKAVSAALIVSVIAVGFTLGRSRIVREWVLASQGTVLIVEPTSVDLTLDEPGARQAFSVRLRNLLHQSVTIVGMQTGCGCLAPPDLPITLPSQQSADVVMTLDSTGRAAGEVWSYEVEFFVDQPSVPAVLHVNARVSQSPAGGDE